MTIPWGRIAKQFGPIFSEAQTAHRFTWTSTGQPPQLQITNDYGHYRLTT
jgi:hypothetical protein